MPTLRRGESKTKWMARCVPVIIAEGKTPAQAIGQCSGMFDNRKKIFGVVKNAQGKLKVVRYALNLERNHAKRKATNDHTE